MLTRPQLPTYGSLQDLTTALAGLTAQLRTLALDDPRRLVVQLDHQALSQQLSAARQSLGDFLL